MDYISFSRRFFAATGVPVTLPERVFIIFQADADISLPASFHRVPGIQSHAAGSD